MGKAVRSNNPFVLGPEDADQIPVKQQPQQPAKSPFVLGAEDTQYVKKKVGGSDLGQDGSDGSLTPSLSPEQAVKSFQDKNLTKDGVSVLGNTDEGKRMGLSNLSPDAQEVFAHAHNGPKQSDLVNNVTNILDTYYPKTADPIQNKRASQTKEEVLRGNQDAISGVKNNIIQGLQKKIDQRKNELFRPRPGTLGAQQYQESLYDNDPTIQQLQKQQREVSQRIDEYGKQALVRSKDMEAWLKLDAEHPNIQTSIAAEKLGKEVEKRYGAERTTPNKEHDRMATGMRLIMESLQMDANEYLNYGIPSKNPELLKRAQDKIATLARYRDLYDKLDTDQFPDVGLDKTARIIGDVIADKHPNKLIRTAADVREAGQILEKQNPGFMQKYGKFVEAAAQLQNQGTFIPRGGGKLNELVGGIVTSSAQSALDLLKWRARAFGYESDKAELEGLEKSPGMRGTSQSRTESTKIVYDKEGKAYREIPDENYSTLPWNNVFRFAGESLPGLAEFVASEGVTSELATGAAKGALKAYNAVGKEIYGTTSALVGAKNIYEGYEAAKLGKGFKDISGLLGATYITSYNSNREFADANIKGNTSTDEAKKTILANLLTIANAGVFHALNASPSKLVEKAISKAVAPDVLEVLEKNSWEQLSKEATSKLLKDKILPRAKAIVQKFGETLEGGAKMGAASVLDQKMHDLAGVMTNKDFKLSTVEDNMRAFVQQGLLMTMVGLPGMVSSGLMPHTTKDALHQAGLYGPQYIDEINTRVENGELDPIKANGMIAMVKTMHEELNKAAKETNDDGTPLTVHQQRDLALAGFRKRAAAMIEEQGIPVSKEKVESEADNEAKNIRAQNNWQNIEETETFKSIKEVGESGEKGEPVKAMEDIDPTKKYTYLKDDKEVATNGAALITHLETGDIYEKEKPDNKKTPDQKTKAAKTETPAAEGKEERTVTGEYKPNIRDDYFAKADFFSPEEKAKFEVLDDAGKDKMIDEKRAELKSKQEGEGSLLEKGKAAINTAADSGKLGVMAEKAKANPEQFLQDIADQALGYSRDSEGNRVKSDVENADYAAREYYGGELVDIAKQLYPEETKPDINESKNAQGEDRGSEEAGEEKGGKKADEKGVLDSSGEAGKTAPELLEEQRKQAENLQSSYDRLIAGGADPNDPDMQRLKERIDNLKPKEDAQNVQETEGLQQPEGSGGGEGGSTEDQTEGSEKEVGPEPSPESKSPIVGIRDSIVNSDRINRGLEPLVKEFTRHWQDNWNQIKQNIRRGFSPRKFIEETAARIAREDKSGEKRSKSRTTYSDYDYATLLFDRLDIQNNIANATDALNEAKTSGDMGAETAAQQLLDRYNEQLIQNDVVGRRMKSESGRALSAIQMITKMDGQLVTWTRDLGQLYHGKMPEALRSFVERIENEYKQKSEDLQKHYEEQLKKAAEDAFKKGQEDAAKEKKTTNPTKSVKAQGKELADKIRGLRDKLGTNKRDNLQSNIFGIPIAIADTALVTIANLVEGGAKLVDAINEALKEVKFPTEKDRNAFIAHLQNTEDPESEQAKRANYLENIKSIAKEQDVTNLPPEANKDLQGLMKSYIKDGIGSLDELVKKTMEDLKDDLPDADERAIRDAFSGYGPKPDGEAKIKTDLAKLKEQARKVSEFQDLLQKPPGETLAQEAKRLEKARKMADEVEVYMREMGIEEEPPPTTPEAKKALALEKSKSRMRSIIEDLNKQILAGERKERNGVTPDKELSVLRAERERLSAQLNEIEKSKLTPEQQIKQVEDAINRQILNYERQIREGVDPLKPKDQRPTTKQVEQLRKRKNELKKQVDGIRRNTDPNYSPQQRALQNYNEGLQKKIWDLEQKIENKDYTEPETAPKVDFTRDAKSVELEARLKKLEGDYYAARSVGEAVNKSWIRKAMSLAAATKRAFVLSRISTFGRLGAAVGWNTIFEPAEALSAAATYGASKVLTLGRFGRDINKLADRYGISSMKDLLAAGKGEIEAFKALGNPQTWKDFVSDAKNGYSELSLMYGKANEGVPKEMRDTWLNIEHGLESFGRAHGAVKGVGKRMEFMRSYAIRKEAAKRKGIDVDNPVIQQSIGAMAYQDAMRSILMENNYVSDLYRRGITELQKGGFGANALALTLQEMMPIVKIPTNLVLNAGRATLGAPLAGVVIAVRGLIDLISKGKSEYGISKLTSEEADALLRNLRKGNVGMALMLGGFFAPNLFGASHYYQKGTSQPEGLEEGEVKFMGLTIPKWLADNPYLVTMKIGASLRNSFEYYTEEKGKAPIPAAVTSFVNTAFSALKETPVLGTPSEAIKAIEGYGGDWFWYSQVKSTVEPGLLQEIAEDTDVKNNEWWKVIGGERIKRKPQSVGEALKTGIPGLREEVEQK